METIKNTWEDKVGCTAKATQRFNKSANSATAGLPKRIRRLKWNELVRFGDLVAVDRQGFQPWEGPSGFRADAFVKPIYRQHESRSTATKKFKKGSSAPQAGAKLDILLCSDG
jgi:hypothetical protein